MNEYVPDKWIVLKLIPIDKAIEPHYRVFANWYGGYAGSDSWKLNSGITSVKLVDGYYDFNGSSGSIYSCHREAYGTNNYGSSVLRGIIKDIEEIIIEIMPEETDWIALKYS